LPFVLCTLKYVINFFIIADKLTNKTEIAVPAPTEKKESSTPSKEVSTIVETVKEKD
jgi:hypothetical protein